MIILKKREKVYLLGLDIGTTNCKAILFDVEKNKKIVYSRKMRTHYTKEGYVFFEPTEIKEYSQENSSSLLR
jgi:glycerol kinase